MNKFSKHYILFFLMLVFSATAQKFVSVKNHQFVQNGNPYYFVGTNFWYASYLGLEKNPERGIERLRKELDFLKSQNVTNIRVLVGVEGSGKINGNNRVEPPYQYEKGKFKDENLKGLDILMDEAGKRNFKVVLFLSNNWEWSGGWLQYLNWNGKIDTETLQKPFNWDDWRDYTSRFYSCEECQNQYFDQVKRIITRKNSVNGKKYTKDKTLMAWEIANEPRPMRPAANENYKKFLAKSSALIKSLDRNHLVTTGSEGEMGTESMELFKQTHQDKNIDYLTIHIWPKNWGWFEKDKMEDGFENAKHKTVDYIEKHIKIADELGKPLVLEEFGFPRDHHSFDINSTTKLRDEYFESALKLWQNSKKEKESFAGVVFWAFGGFAKPQPNQVFWKKGDDYMGDPPMEEQGLNSVFVNDKSTWETIRKYSGPK
ncbi:glycoside hydrolase 5 family protein [Chryseobacterium taklimakanense]|uniref:glycoside hydrolase 5 family protein n=1 Tax=Chryseobacterium taklimakanense TaxID=536441 RepID=UPI001E35E8E7|nr:cellulase family glycosylhydrolase [Chryseobacterium taklimakanense]